MKLLKAFSAFETLALKGWFIIKPFLTLWFLNCYKKIVISGIDDKFSNNKIEVKCQMLYEYLHVTL